jgi:hypothetical protein
MKELNFLIELSKTEQAYDWRVYGSNKIVAVAKNGKTKGYKFDPVTALCRSKGLGVYQNTRGGRRAAARKLGITPSMLTQIENATLSRSNRGHGQALRGKIRQVVGL